MRNTGPQVYMKYYMKNCSPSIDNDQGGTRSALSPLLVRLPPTLASHIRELVAPIIDTFAREEDIQKERDGASKSSGFTSTAILLVLVGALATILSFSRSKLRASKAKYVEMTTPSQYSGHTITIATRKSALALWQAEFVKSELTIKSFRIDTLCYDKTNGSFVIIEYKNTKNYSVIDQGYTYLSLLLNNKSDFILEYNEIKNRNLKRSDVDWTQSKVIFISPHYTDYQKNSVNFKDVPFELWEIKRFENDTFILNQHKVESNESISSTSKIGEDNIVNSVSREVKLYTEEYHTSNPRVKEEGISIYNKFKERVLSLGDDIEIRPRKDYLGFIRKTNFVDVQFQSRNLKIFINLKIGELDDPKNICRDVSNVGHWGNGDYQLKVEEDSDLDYIMFLVKQSYSVKV